MADDPDRAVTVERNVLEHVPPDRGSPRHAYLIVLSGNAAGAIFRLDRRVMTIGRGTKSDVRLSDDGVSRAHARLIRRSGGRYLREDLGSTNGTYVGAERIDERVIEDGERFCLGDATFLKFSFADEFEERFHRHLYESAVLDGLTGIYNRKHFLDHLAGEVSYSHRHGSDLTLMMIDIDDFKSVNDAYGHQAGDAVLEAIGTLLRTQLRSEDIAARYGGEEFCVLARGVSRMQSLALAERLRHKVEGLEVWWAERALRVTISVGVAAFHKQCVASAEALIGRADKALYRAKALGRNRVVLDDDVIPGL